MKLKKANLSTHYVVVSEITFKIVAYLPMLELEGNSLAHTYAHNVKGSLSGEKVLVNACKSSPAEPLLSCRVPG